MTQINPAHVLIAIVSLCGLTVLGAIVLMLCGDKADVSTLLAITGPVIAALLGLKVELIRRATKQTAADLAVKVEQAADAATETTDRHEAAVHHLASAVQDVQDTVNGNHQALQDKLDAAVQEIAELKALGKGDKP